jgi:hypothetical protein
VLSEANDFIWPGPDLRPAIAGDASSVAYGFLPPKFMDAIKPAWRNGGESVCKPSSERNEVIGQAAPGYGDGTCEIPGMPQRRPHSLQFGQAKPIVEKAGHQGFHVGAAAVRRRDGGGSRIEMRRAGNADDLMR